MAPQRKDRPGEEEGTSICSNTVLLVLGLLCVLIGVVLVIIGSVKLHVTDNKCGQTPSVAKSTAPKSTQTCNFSAEAVRVGLPALLEEVKTAYFKHSPDNVAWNPDLRGAELSDYVKTRCEVDVVHVLFSFRRWIFRWAKSDLG